MRERIAAAREHAELGLEYAFAHEYGGEVKVAVTGIKESAKHARFLANALEAVLEAAPCSCGVTREIAKRGINHRYVLPAWLEAALTRATATTEGVL